MKHKSHSVTKNTLYLTFALIGQKIFSFIYFTLIARYIGVYGNGAYTFAISYSTLFGAFVDIGLTPVLIRDVAKDHQSATRTLNQVISIKIILAAIVFIVIGGSAVFLDKSPEIKLMVFLASFVMLTDIFSMSFWGVFRGLQNLFYEAVSIFFTQAIILSFGASVIFLHGPIYLLVIALLCGGVFNVGLAYVLLKKKLQFSFSFTWDKPAVRAMLVVAFPFALAAIFTRIYSYIDQIMLSFFSGEHSLGLYSVPYKITFALQFIPMAFAAAIYPAMSSYFESNTKKLRELFEKSMLYMFVVGFPIAFGIFALAENIIISIYTDAYAESVLALQIMILSVIFVFASFPIGSLLNACHKHTQNTLNMGIVMVLNIVANIILIPMYKHIGSSIAVLLSNIALVILGMIWVRSVISYDKIKLVKNFLYSGISAGLMAVGVIYLKQYMSFIYTIPIGAAIYSVMIFFVFRVMEYRDIFKVYKENF